MNIQDKNIAYICSFEAPYGGNFIRMLLAISKSLRDDYNCNVFFVFPTQAVKAWINEIENEYTVGYVHGYGKKCVCEIQNYLETWDIDIVHTHFDNFDIPVAKAVNKIPRKVCMVWHLHDYLSLDKSGMSIPFIRKVGTHLRFWRQYGYYGKNAFFIGVSAEVTTLVEHYRRSFFTIPKPYSDKDLLASKYDRAAVVINGIDLNRIDDGCNYQFPLGKVVFLSFGGESYSKGIPCIFDAAEILERNKYDFEIHITRGYSTELLLKSKYGKQIPSWLRLVEQTDDVKELYKNCSCYISASLKETMSMAIAESSIYGLPVIQSDIPGTMWNAHNPSVFLFHVNDSSDLASQMMKIIDMDKIKLKRLCEQTSVNNRKELSMQRWCERIISIYQSL